MLATSSWKIQVAGCFSHSLPRYVIFCSSHPHHFYAVNINTLKTSTGYMWLPLYRLLARMGTFSRHDRGDGWWKSWVGDAFMRVSQIAYIFSGYRQLQEKAKIGKAKRSTTGWATEASSAEAITIATAITTGMKAPIVEAKTQKRQTKKPSFTTREGITVSSVPNIHTIGMVTVGQRADAPLLYVCCCWEKLWIINVF